jgi:branched-chain amino acid transport system permease protein
VLLGGLCALFAAGLSLLIEIMRLVNRARGDLILAAAFPILVSMPGLHPFLAAALDAPMMFAAGWLLQRPVLDRTPGKDILPPLLATFGLSVALRNALPEGFSADTRRSPGGAPDTASPKLGGGDGGRAAALDVPDRRCGHRGAACGLPAHAPWAGVPGDFGRSGNGEPDGHPAAVGRCRCDRPCDGRGDARRAPSRDAVELRPLHRVGAGDPCLRGRHHRRPRKPLGHAGAGIITGAAQTVGAAIDPDWQSLAGHVAFLVVLLIRPRGLHQGAVD